MAPKAVKIAEFDEDHKLTLYENNLKSIVYHPKARNNPVCVISIAGAFRKGKSFLLNFFIRFFKNEGEKGWINNENDQMNGFHWCPGSERDTTGIFMWSEPYLVRTVQNEQVAVLIMDTQGSFDSSTTVKDCATLFALSLMVSSIQFYNLSQNIQEDDLQNLNLFSDYGRLALDLTSQTPFQMLIFLVRDWPYHYEYEYGFNGGQKFLAKKLNITNKNDREMLETRYFIKNCFKQIKCFLMPHPGLKAANSSNFSGKISELDPSFRHEVVNLVESVLNDKIFQLKQINGQNVTCIELIEYFKIYCRMFQNCEMPNPKSLLRATAEANNLAAKSLVKEYYAQLMDSQIGLDKPYVNTDLMEKIHIDAKLKSVKKFETIKKMGGPEISRQYLKELIVEIDDMLQRYCESNEAKKSSQTGKTPLTLFSIMVVNYLLAWFFNLIWMDYVSFLFVFGFYTSLIVVVFWLFCKYKNDYKELCQFIDFIAAFIWDNVLRLFGSKFLVSFFNFTLNNFPNITAFLHSNDKQIFGLINKKSNSKNALNIGQGDSNFNRNSNIIYENFKQ